MRAGIRARFAVGKICGIFLLGMVSLASAAPGGDVVLP